MKKHNGNSIKHVKTIASKNKTKKNHGKVQLTHPTHLHFLGSVMNGNKNTNKKMMRIKSKTLTLIERREKRAIERSFLFFFFVCLDRRENKYIERINIKRGINLIYKGEQYDE